MTREHGGADALGVPQWDFSTNANACGPCPSALRAVQQADARHYPDPAYKVLRESLAAFHAVDPARIVLAASASEFVARITAWVAREGGQRVWLPELAYGDYASAAACWGLERANDPAQAQLAWLCEPSSPLGGAEPFAPQVISSGAVTVLDLAYEPLRLQGRSSLPRHAFDRVWQLWTPNKALGLTGVRGAYAISPVHARAEASALDRLAPSWPLGVHAVALLQAWRQQGHTVIVVLHDDTLVRQQFPQTLLIARELIAWGATADTLTTDRLQQARAMAEAWDDDAEMCQRDTAPQHGAFA